MIDKRKGATPSSALQLHSRWHLSHVDPTLILDSQPTAVDPGRVAELRTLHDHLRALDVPLLLHLLRDILDPYVDAGTEAEDQTGVFAIQDEVATSEEHLAGCGHGRGGGSRHRMSDVLLSSAGR